jgi:mono/diheme cytochrome c family protein
MVTSPEIGPLLESASYERMDRGSTSKPVWAQGSIYLLFILELFALVSAFWAFVVLRNIFPNAHDTQLISAWFLVAVVSAILATVYFVLAWNANRRRNHELAKRLLTIAIASGIVMLGILAVLISRVAANDPNLLDISAYYQTDVPPAAEPVSSGPGDAATGKALFGMTCATCHGPTGDGIANNAPSLRASGFLKSSDGATVASLIRTGRSATDPANKTGKVMPARGGNPFLDEAKISDLAAFLKSLDSQLGSTIEGGGGSESAPIVQLNRWVLPVAEEKYSALFIDASGSRTLRATTDYESRWAASIQRRYQSSLSILFVWGASVLTFHFVWVMGMASGVVLHRELHVDDAKQLQLFRQSLLYWMIGVVALLIWFFMFVWFG